MVTGLVQITCLELKSSWVMDPTESLGSGMLFGICFGICSKSSAILHTHTPPTTIKNLYILPLWNENHKVCPNHTQNTPQTSDYGTYTHNSKGTNKLTAFCVLGLHVPEMIHFVESGLPWASQSESLCGWILLPLSSQYGWTDE